MAKAINEVVPASTTETCPTLAAHPESARSQSVSTLATV